MNRVRTAPSLPPPRARRAAALSLLLVGAALLALRPAQAADVGVSISVSQPGVYGRIDIGRFPAPQVVLPQPVIIAAPAVVQVRPEPVYLWVPPGHRKNWRKHCGQYGACGVPVYFVDDGWYDRHVHPQGKGRGKGDGKHDGKGHGKHGDDHGKGQGKGREKD